MRRESVQNIQKPTPQVTNIMKGNRSTNTKLELVVRKELWRNGCRGYRINYKKLPGKPDIVYPTHKLAIFIHGCFWHSCPKCNRSQPKRNADFWKEKFERNRERDDQTKRKLIELGWRVLVVWECEIKKYTQKVIEDVKNLLGKSHKAKP